jgi:polygalacturonase
VFRRLVALSGTRGLKCGQQAYEPMRRIRFEDVDIVQTRDGIDLMHWDGFGAWEDILFRNIRVEKCERRSLTATVREGGGIHGVLFENVRFDELRPGFMRGKDAAHRIEGVVFSGLRIGGELVTSLEAAGLTTNKFVSPVTFDK